MVRHIALIFGFLSAASCHAESQTGTSFLIKGLERTPVTALSAEQKGELVGTASNGLWRVPHSANRAMLVDGIPRQATIQKIASVKGGSIIDDGNILWLLENKKNRGKPLVVGLNSGGGKLFQAGTESALFVTANSASKIGRQSFYITGTDSRFQIEIPFGASQISEVFSTSGLIYIGTRSEGLWSLRVDDLKVQRVPGVPIGAFVTCLSAGQNSLFVGTAENGCWRVNLNTGIALPRLGARQCFVKSVFVQGNSVYVLTRGRGLWSCEEDGTDKTINLPEEFRDLDSALFWDSFALLSGNDGRSGIFRVDGPQLHHIGPGKLLLSSPHALFEAGKKLFLLGQQGHQSGDGTQTFIQLSTSPVEVAVCTNAPELVRPTCTQVTDDYLFIGTEDGLHRFVIPGKRPDWKVNANISLSPGSKITQGNYLQVTATSKDEPGIYDSQTGAPLIELVEIGTEKKATSQWATFLTKDRSSALYGAGFVLKSVGNLSVRATYFNAFGEKSTIFASAQVVDPSSTTSNEFSQFLRYMLWPLCWLACGALIRLSFFVTPPLWILKANNILGFLKGLPFPDKFKWVKECPQFIFWVGFFQYEPSVLDAWVAKYAEFGKEYSKSLITKAFVEIPVRFLDGEHIPTAARFRPIFETKNATILLRGEGGSGKTTLAYHMASWALEKRDDLRLGKHRMIPILINGNLGGSGDTALLEQIKRQLKFITREEVAPTDELVRNLLQKRRILVIADDFHERDEKTRNAVIDSANSLIIASRQDLDIRAPGMYLVGLGRLKWEDVTIFISQYISKTKGRQLSNSDFFGELKLFADLVGDRDVTPLLTELYAMYIVDPAEIDKVNRPNSIPDLMEFYVAKMAGKGDILTFPVRKVKALACKIAWSCLRSTLTSRQTPFADVEEYLANTNDRIALPSALTDPGSVIDYFTDRLGLLERRGAAQDFVTFSLDPVAEYLAANYLVEYYFRSDENKWNQFLTEAQDKDAPEGFLRSLADVIKAKGTESGVPPVVLSKLKEQFPSLLGPGASSREHIVETET